MADPVAVVAQLMDAIQQGGDVSDLLADGVHFRSDVVGVLDKPALIDHLHGRRIQPKDQVMKRNLMFVWWIVDGIDGPEEQGTWIIAIDQDGLVVEWQEFRG